MRTRWIIAVVMVLIGAAWIGQGLGFFPGTGFMDGDRTWAVIGGVILLGGLAVGWSAVRLGRRV